MECGQKWYFQTWPIKTPTHPPMCPWTLQLIGRKMTPRATLGATFLYGRSLDLLTTWWGIAQPVTSTLDCFESEVSFFFLYLSTNIWDGLFLIAASITNTALNTKCHLKVLKYLYTIPLLPLPSFLSSFCPSFSPSLSPFPLPHFFLSFPPSFSNTNNNKFLLGIL